LIQKTLGYYQVAIYTLSNEPNILVLKSISGAHENWASQPQTIKFGQGLAGLAAQNKTGLRANNILIESHASSSQEDIPTRSEMAIPILIEDEIIGVLDIHSSLSYAFDQNDEQVMQIISGQIGIAIENARLYEELHRQLRERERRENILRIQRDLLVRMNTAQTMKETLKTTLDVLSSELNASRGVITLVDRETQELVHGASYSNINEKSILPPLVIPQVAEGVVRMPIPFIYHNTRLDKSTYPNFNPAVLYIPLMLDKKVIGVIILESGSGRNFTQEDIMGVNNLVNSMVMLIERARLFEELQKARSELEIRAGELEKANANLLELDRLKNQFLMNISHELRTPLNSIIGFSEVILDELAGPVNNEQREYSQDILDSGRHLLDLINNLLDFSKSSAHKMDLRVSSFTVEKLFQELQNTMAPMIARKSQNLIFHQEPDLPTIRADYLRIKQVLFNLISNANKFTPNYGSIMVSCRNSSPTEILFEVKDTGIGIREEDYELIFEEYRQVDGSLTREAPGTGLGLTISRRIIEIHHGKIWVKSIPGHGATFFVLLPFDGNQFSNTI